MMNSVHNKIFKVKRATYVTSYYKLYENNSRKYKPLWVNRYNNKYNLSLISWKKSSCRLQKL